MGERQAALDALETHAREGRLDAQELAARQYQVSAATSAAELDRVFADLPEPKPQPRSWSQPPYLPATAATTASVQPAAPRRPDPVGHGSVRFWSIVAGLLWPIALVFFLRTGEWWWFLLPAIVMPIVRTQVRLTRRRELDERSRRELR